MHLKNPGRWWMLPETLKQLNQWVLRGGNDKKQPINPNTRELAKAENPTTWGSFDLVKNSDNIGFELPGFIGIDFDHIYKPYYTIFCVWAWEWVKKFAAVTYTEYSPSGTGCHVIGKGEFLLGEKDPKQIYDQESPLVKKGKRWVRDVNALIVTPKPTNGTIEGGRFFTITGNAIGTHEIGNVSDIIKQFYSELLMFLPSKTPKKSPNNSIIHKQSTPHHDDAEILELLAIAANHDKFDRLLAGDTSGYPSPSEADLACARGIAFYTQDASQIERIMRRTGLEREKWDKHKTYLANTIGKAIAATTTYYISR